MNKFVNHYEILNVSNTASLEEIRASYRALCKMFHPDLNPNMADGILMIEELTKSYEVLKDADQREDYDLVYLVEMRRHSARSVQAAPAAPVQRQVQQLAPVVEKLPDLPALPLVEEVVKVAKVIAISEAKNEALDNHIRNLVESKRAQPVSGLKTAAVAAIAIIGISLMALAIPAKTLSRISVFNIEKIISQSSYVRPVTAPNGVAFPETSSYISGYEIGKNDGQSSLMVNNAKNANDVYLKLVSIEGDKVSTIRHVLVKGKTDFKIENLSTGKYEIQYLDLVAGLAGKSEIFSVEETKTDLGTTKTTSLSVNLQQATNGVLRIQNISMDEFNKLASL